MNTSHHFRFPRLQAGGSAVEFALVLPLFVLVLWGLITFGSMLYAQMSLSRAAADGVRALSQVDGLATYASVTEPEKQVIRLEVINSLTLSLLSPLGLVDYPSRREWMEQNVMPLIAIDNGSCGGGGLQPDALRVRVAYPYAAVRILPSIELPMIGSLDSWMPQTLSGCAIAQL